MEFRCELEREDFLAVAIAIEQIEVRPSGPALEGRLEVLYGELAGGRAGIDDRSRAATRSVLRNGRYRPSGRGKPASEYLLGVWQKQGRLDSINNAADANNLVSLRHGLPVSAFDVRALRGDLVVRLGRPGEAYVFNASGQILDCADLVAVCDESGPVGSPVKDSQATKVFPGTDAVLYVVYGSLAVAEREQLLAVAAELGEVLVEDCPGARAGDPRPFVRGALRPVTASPGPC